MAITGAGFDGTLTEADWALISGPQGVPDSTLPGASTSDFAVAASTTVLQATVAAGTYNRHGILTRSDADSTVSFTNPASGSRWDCVALLLDWTTNTVSLVVVQGTSSQTVPWASMEKTPGAKAHVPLALVELTAGAAAPSTVVDLRWGVWISPTVATGNGFAGLSSGDKAQYRIHNGMCVLRGAVLWVSGSAVDVGIFNNLPVPQTSYADHMVGTGQATSGGIASLLLNTTNIPGQLYMKADSQVGVWSTSGNTYIRLSVSYPVG